MAKSIDFDVSGLALDGPGLKTRPGELKASILTSAGLVWGGPGNVIRWKLHAETQFSTRFEHKCEEASSVITICRDKSNEASSGNVVFQPKQANKRGRPRANGLGFGVLYICILSRRF